MNKLIPLFILPCTLALYVLDFHFCKPHPASQIEIATETIGQARTAPVIETADTDETTSVTEVADKAETAPVTEATDNVEAAPATEATDNVEAAPATEATEAPVAPVPEASAEVETTAKRLYYPSDLVAEVNSYRSSYGLSALSEDSQLDYAAAVRCNELLVSMSHTRPDGRSCSTIYAELGIYPSCWGENLAAGYCTVAGTASDWMSSDGHRANILNSAFTKCGVAHISCDYGYYDYWVILFSD